MNSGKHTPGPWKHLHDADGDYAIYSAGAIRAKEKLIAITDCDSETDQANARLMAAAPDMLEALEAIVDSAHDGREYPSWLHERLEQLAIPAIRKAVGDGR